jgi:hypothetical protein
MPDLLFGAGPLSQLAAPHRARTRTISAENVTGGRGEGALAVPDLNDADLPHSRLAIDLGRGFKVRPFGWCRRGETLTIADVAGAGVIRHIWIASNVPDMSTLRLKAYWDGAAEPALDVTLADFFCLGGPGHANTVSSLPIVVGPVRGCSSFWSMPFASHALIQITNEGGTDAEVVAYYVTYEETDVDDFDGSRFHAKTIVGQADPKTWEFDIAQIDGAGNYVGTSMNWRALTPRWWGEGEVKPTWDTMSSRRWSPPAPRTTSAEPGGSAATRPWCRAVRRSSGRSPPGTPGRPFCRPTRVTPAKSCSTAGTCRTPSASRTASASRFSPSAKAPTNAMRSAPTTSAPPVTGTSTANDGLAR